MSRLQRYKARWADPDRPPWEFWVFVGAALTVIAVLEFIR